MVPDVLPCPPAKKSHIYKGGFLLSDRSSQGVIIMESTEGNVLGNDFLSKLIAPGEIGQT